VLAVCVQAPNKVCEFYRGYESFCGSEVLFKSIIWVEVTAGNVYWGFVDFVWV
jgi:hypothetical protein